VLRTQKRTQPSLISAVHHPNHPLQMVGPQRHTKGLPAEHSRPILRSRAMEANLGAEHHIVPGASRHADIRHPEEIAGPPPPLECALRAASKVTTAKCVILRTSNYLGAAPDTSLLSRRRRRSAPKFDDQPGFKRGQAGVREKSGPGDVAEHLTC